MSKVKIVAIAKDEGAYIAEWVFHHLYFGFDAIDIYINRTTDNTTNILDKISSQYPNINYFYADWIDMHPKQVSHYMQKIIYSQAFKEEQYKDDFTHILFIDIDEFWTPLNFRDSIHSCLLSLPKNVSISFQWFNILGEKVPFNYITKSINGFTTHQIKSICPLNADIDMMGIHLSKFHKNNKFKGYFLSDGSSFVHNKDKLECLTKTQAKVMRPCIILHRMFRSEIEYISLLYKGRAGDNSSIKLNRMGFIETIEIKNSIDFDDNSYSQYEKEREIFIIKLHINDELEKAKEFVLKRAQLTIAALPQELNNNYENIFKVLSGLRNAQIISILEDTKEDRKIIEKYKLEFSNINIDSFEKTEDILGEISSVFKKYGDQQTVDNINKDWVLICENIRSIKMTADVLRNMAFVYERKNNIDQAYKIMQKALWLRPSGLLIQEKLKKYKEETKR